ncbi:MAG: energy transducer TonB [Alphaproteobacteria bacterium GM7ARS4]|nr:energy transducer TonB [Alphaproteobacteria bacterium GM7ARS4]
MSQSSLYHMGALLSLRHVVYGCMLSVIVHGMVLVPFFIKAHQAPIPLEAQRPYAMAVSMRVLSPPPPRQRPTQGLERQDITPQEQSPRSSLAQSRQQKKREENYLTGIYRAIDRHKIYPRAALRRHMEGSITIRLTIGQNGHILHMELVDEVSSLFADAARQAVLDAAPFMPFPSSWTKTSIDITIPIHYRIAREEPHSTP